MNNVTFFEDELTGVALAIIDNGDGSFISMHKSAYDEMIAKQEELGSE